MRAKMLTLLLAASLGVSCSPDDDSQTEILRFTVQPAEVTAGAVVTVDWEVQGAEAVMIDPGLGLREAKGRLQVSVQHNSRFSLKVPLADGEFLEATRQVTVIGPQVLSFFAMPGALGSEGQKTELKWTTKNAARVEISGIKEAQPANGKLEVSPQQDTIYKLVAFSGEARSQELKAEVVVDANAQPVIDRFYLNPAGGPAGTPTELVWAVRRAATVLINGQAQPPEGSLQLTPSAGDALSLQASGPNGKTVTATTAFYETDTTGLQILDFSPNPRRVTEGSEATLRWATLNATRVEITPELGEVRAAGMARVMPTAGQVYTLRADGPGGPLTQRIEFEVIPSNVTVKIQSFTVEPKTATVGDWVRLRWKTEHATRVEVFPGPTDRPPQGELRLRLDHRQRFELVAHGPHGPARAEVTVEVAHKEGDSCANALPVGDSASLSGDRAGFVDQLQFELPGGGTTVGRDVVYALTLGAGDVLTATPNTPATRLFVLDSCSQPSPLARPSDNGSLSFTAPHSKRYYLVVDGDDDQASAYQVDIQRTPKAPDVPSPVATSGLYEGNTQAATNDLTACGTDKLPGGDVAYPIQLNAGDMLYARLEGLAHDGALALLAGDSCLRFEDSLGRVEQLRYTSPSDQQVQLVVDSDHGSTGGPYRLQIAVAQKQTASTPSWRLPSGLYQRYTAALEKSGGASCTTGYPGQEHAFLLDLEAGDQVNVDTGNAAVVAMLTAADAAPICSSGPQRSFSVPHTGPYKLLLDRKDHGSDDYNARIEHRDGRTCRAAYNTSLLRKLFDTNPYTTYPVSTPAGVGDYALPRARCGLSAVQGAERVFKVHIEAGEQLIAEFKPRAGSNGDPALYLVKDCDDIGHSCVAGVDAHGPGQAERLRALIDQTGDYFLFVDGRSPGAIDGDIVDFGTWSGNLCFSKNSSYEVPSDGGHFHGTTEGHLNSVDSAAKPCTGNPQAGPEVGFEVRLPPGKRLEAELHASSDMSLYLLSGCSAQVTCLAGSDQAVTPHIERLSYTNTSPSERVLKLVVDSQVPGAGARFDLDIHIR